MAELNILAIGRLKPEEETLQTRYLDRIRKSGPSLGIKRLHINELSESKQQNSAERKSDEAARLLKKSTNHGFLIALDETGKELSSRNFAELLQRQLTEGQNNIAFALGGPDGHGAELRKASNYSLALSEMTLPHGLARILLLEQIYRALTIWSGHPYHRD